MLLVHRKNIGLLITTFVFLILFIIGLFPVHIFIYNTFIMLEANFPLFSFLLFILVFFVHIIIPFSFFSFAFIPCSTQLCFGLSNIFICLLFALCIEERNIICFNFVSFFFTLVLIPCSTQLFPSTSNSW